MMWVTEEEADLIIEAFGYKATETILYDDDEALIRRILTIFPKLKEEYYSSWHELFEAKA
jgi:hypothetical protein